MRSRAARLGSVAAFLGEGSGSLRKTPRMDVARAFGTWVCVAEARKVCRLRRLVVRCSCLASLRKWSSCLALRSVL